jgi:hypothetical protein
MQKAFTVLALMRFTSQRQRWASWLKRAAGGMSFLAISRSLSTCRRSVFNAPCCAAARIIWPYCCAEEFSTVDLGSSRRLFLTSTPT